MILFRENKERKKNGATDPFSLGEVNTKKWVTIQCFRLQDTTPCTLHWFMWKILCGVANRAV